MLLHLVRKSRGPGTVRRITDYEMVLKVKVKKDESQYSVTFFQSGLMTSRIMSLVLPSYG